MPCSEAPAPSGNLATCARLLCLAAAAASVAMIAACGGGSPSGNTAPPPPPAPSPQPIAAQLTVPNPVGYDADHLAAFNRLNELRVAAGLGMLYQSTELDKAAQAHTEWSIENDEFSHVEPTGSKGFTGINWFDRDAAAGYPVSQGTEVIATGAAPAAAIDGLVNMAYHRAGLFQFEPLDVGIGYSRLGVEGFNGMIVADMAYPDDGSDRSAGQLPQSKINAFLIWPVDGAKGVVSHMGDEVPNPVPGVDVLTLGTPISVEVPSTEQLTVARFQLFNDVSEELIPTTLLMQDSDPNRIVAPYVAEIIPSDALPFDTRFRVEFVGSAIDPSDLTQRDCSRTWRFETGEVNYPSNGF
jgi:uncharacterized protein YkwD